MFTKRNVPRWLEIRVRLGRKVLAWSPDEVGAVTLEQRPEGFVVCEYAASTDYLCPQRQHLYEHWEYNYALGRLERESRDLPVYEPEGTPHWWDSVAEVKRGLGIAEGCF